MICPHCGKYTKSPWTKAGPVLRSILAIINSAPTGTEWATADFCGVLQGKVARKPIYNSLNALVISGGLVRTHYGKFKKPEH